MLYSYIVKWSGFGWWSGFGHLRHSLESNNVSPKMCTEYIPNFELKLKQATSTPELSSTGFTE